MVADLQAAAYESALTRAAHGDLLDLGAGAVPLYGMYRDLVTSVTCVDWAGTTHVSPHLDLQCDLREPLPFADASFDTVVLTDVLEHLAYPDRLMGEIARVLRPGGSLVLGVPFLYPLHEQPHDHQRYSEHRLRLFCDDHGLVCESLWAYGGPAAVVLDQLAKMLGMLPALRRLAGLPALVARPRDPDAAPTPAPLGYVMVARR